MTHECKRWVIIPAGGTGTRMGLPYPKQLLPYRGKPLIAHILALFSGERVVIPVPAAARTTFEAVLGENQHVLLVDGGDTRYASVRNAFEAINPEDDTLVLIHDAARPFLDVAGLEGAWTEAARREALIYASAATDTIKQVGVDGAVAATLDRNFIYHAQTPQIFTAGALRQAYAHYDQNGGPLPTDEAALLEMAGKSVYIWQSNAGNRKLTHKEDLALLDESQLRIGHGYDVHRFDPQRPLYLGGVFIEEGPGLLGHSDADVVLHALIDAMLGAAGLGDIGQHFPDTSSEFKDIRSTVLLDRVWRDLKARGWRLCNADITVQAQIPKLAPHITAMRETLSQALDGAPINVKATTTERLGFVGQEEGMACHAVVLLKKEAS